jgi:acyl carrier protein
MRYGYQMSEDVSRRIRKVLKEHGRLSVDPHELAEDSDLYEAGLTSHASLSIMLALEREFEIHFPDEMLIRSVFSNIVAIRSAVDFLSPG